MGVREWTRTHPKAVAAISGVVVLACIVAIIVEVMMNRQRYPSAMPNAYFTTDDGASFFVASVTNNPPFDHGGMPAVKAHVFQCSGGKKFVGYLERYTADTKKMLDEGKQLSIDTMRFGREVKRPGDTTWVKTVDRAAENKISNVLCPNGGSDLTSVLP